MKFVIIFTEMISAVAVGGNDRLVSKDDVHEFRFCAEPDCNTFNMPVEEGAWYAFALEIYWTRSNNGYYRLYDNSVLVEERLGVKTLFGSFVPGTCDIMWGLGLYMDWRMIEGGATSFKVFIYSISCFV